MYVIARSSTYLVRAGPLGAISPTFASIRGGFEQPHWMKRGLGDWRAEASVVVESTSVSTIARSSMKLHSEQRMTPMHPVVTGSRHVPGASSMTTASERC